MTQTYDDLIREAFIDPIRSVLIVDDDYPTTHEILLEADEQKRRYGYKDWNRSSKDRSKVRKVIDEFRRKDAPYLLDIHDGSSPSEEIDEKQVGTLHQTDLLILDYQLDKTKEKDGSIAVRLAREALSNKHFNLILVHTQEDLGRVFYEFLIGLFKPCLSDKAPGEIHAELQEFLDSHEADFLASISDEQYASARDVSKQGENIRELISLVHAGKAPWADAFAILNGKGLHRRHWPAAILHALTIFEENNKDRFGNEELGVVYWKNGTTRFIRAARGFVAFKSKDDDQELIPTMLRALVAWDPRPPRLMLTKLRAEMNERGIEVQDHALGDSDIGAVWYQQLLQADQQNLNAIVDRTVRNHAEQLLDKLLPNVSNFAKRIREVDAKSDSLTTIKKRFSIDLSDNKTINIAKVGHNAFVGSKPTKSAHLEIGHILKISSDYWMCLTPACDMVPKVYRGKPADRIQGVKRFTAVKLVPRKFEEGLADANRGGQIFANIYDAPGKTKRCAFAVASQIGASPAWMMMYVQNDGYLPDVEAPECDVSFVAAPEAAVSIPVIKSEKAVVCGMLRYEYALEVQSRFIASQSRIGLDFVSLKTPTADEDA